jgi:hypothetical protein
LHAQGAKLLRHNQINYLGALHVLDAVLPTVLRQPPEPRLIFLEPGVLATGASQAHPRCCAIAHGRHLRVAGLVSKTYRQPSWNFRKKLLIQE